MLTNRSGACGFTPLRRRTFKSDEIKSRPDLRFITTCVVIHTDFFLPLGTFTPIWPVLFWICPLSTMSGVLFFTIARERLAPPKTVPQRSAEITLPPPLKRTGTRRNLFGPVDHDELSREISSKLREISERDQLRWNFNFSEGQPLDGDLKWEESRAEDCPQFYRETTAVSKRPFGDLPATERVTQVAPKCGGHSVMILNQKNQINKCNRRKLSRKTVARVQTKRLMRITDFYGKRKKTDSVHKESGN